MLVSTSSYATGEAFLGLSVVLVERPLPAARHQSGDGRGVCGQKAFRGGAMRHLLNTLYVFTEDAYLMLDGENVVVRRDGAELGRVPLHTLEGILCFSYRGASPALWCLRRTGRWLVVLRSEGSFPCRRIRRAARKRAAAKNAVCMV